MGVPLWAHQHRQLTASATAHTYHIDCAAEAEGSSAAAAATAAEHAVELTVVKPGLLHAIALWVDPTLWPAKTTAATSRGGAAQVHAPDAILECGSPDATRMYQRQGLRLFEANPPREVAPGDKVRVVVRPRGPAGTRFEVEVL